MPEQASPVCGLAPAAGQRAGEDPETVLAQLASALVEIGPLSGALDSTPQVAPLGPGTERPADLDAVQTLIDRLVWELDARALRVVADPSGLVAAELAISNRLGIASLLDRSVSLGGVSDALVAAAGRQARRGWPAMTVAAAPDGSTLRCYAVGPPDGPAVVLVSACGMPVGLLRRWMIGLGDRFRVLTWESRGMFSTREALDEDFDQRGYDVPTQADDLHAVLDVFDVETAHVVGLCGGAAVALAAGPARVRSLSLWHGDYELGPDVPKTRHQQDVQSLMLMAGRQRQRAASLHALLRRPATLENLRADLAHELIYPYANAELLYRYGRLNGAIMTTDCRPLLAGIDLPTLVVSSMVDTTAHPEGSVFVASHIPGARLELLPRGDHLAAFDAAPELIELARAFIDQVQREGT
ncbi:MAG TPA: alpha/beta fold hydrolase [Pseudonocardiaceae bacterium]|nr:alpha/beta fold hydrolase [Pseudonocardiaceae bacterium]